MPAIPAGYDGEHVVTDTGRGGRAGRLDVEPQLGRTTGRASTAGSSGPAVFTSLMSNRIRRTPRSDAPPLAGATIDAT
jgi:hypothetical protein